MSGRQIERMQKMHPYCGTSAFFEWISFIFSIYISKAKGSIWINHQFYYMAEKVARWPKNIMFALSLGKIREVFFSKFARTHPSIRTHCSTPFSRNLVCEWWLWCVICCSWWCWCWCWRCCPTVGQLDVWLILFSVSSFYPFWFPIQTI